MTPAPNDRKKRPARRNATGAKSPPIYPSLAHIPDDLPNGGPVLLQTQTVHVRVTQRQIDAVRNIQRDASGRIVGKATRNDHAAD